jgi:hypothetical protein
LCCHKENTKKIRQLFALLKYNKGEQRESKKGKEKIKEKRKKEKEKKSTVGENRERRGKEKLK